MLNIEGYAVCYELCIGVVGWLQVIVLQTRMHTALTDVYRLLESLTDTSLTSLETESHDSGVRLTQVHERFEDALARMTDFLQAATKGNASVAAGKQPPMNTVTPSTQPIPPPLPPIGSTRHHYGLQKIGSTQVTSDNRESGGQRATDIALTSASAPLLTVS